MPIYSLTNKGNIIQCKSNCNCSHEHFVGSYERAVKYFGIEQKEIKSYGNHLNIIIYHQTSPQTIPKLSNELYDILINAMAEHKYWVEPLKRHDAAMNILDEANKRQYIMDNLICKTIKQHPENIKAQKRIYFYELWKKQNDI